MPDQSIPDAAILEALNRLEKAKQEVIEAKANVEQQCVAYILATPSKEEMMERASFVYWEIPETSVTSLAIAIFGDPNKTSMVVNSIPSRILTTKCLNCGSENRIRQRSRSSQTGYRPSYIGYKRTWKVCPKCHPIKVYGSIGCTDIETQTRLEELRTMPYHEYLLSPEWKDKRIEKLRQAGSACELCQARGRLDIHHKTYERRGNEDLGDLMVLCRECHSKIHEKES